MNEQEELEYLQLKKRKAMSIQAPQKEGFSVPPMLQGAAKAITMPGRGMRGLGVGAERMLLHPTQPGSAIQRAAEAVKPGYQAQSGEKIGSFMGSQLDPINLAMNEFLPGGSLLKSAVSGGLGAGGASALDQASRGRVRPSEVGLASAMGGVLGGGIHGVSKAPGALLRNAPAILKKTTNIPEAATHIFTENPGIENAIKGSAEFHEENIREKSFDVSKSLETMLKNAKSYWDKAAQKTGIKQTAAERSRAKEIPSTQIANAIDNAKKLVTKVMQPVNPNKGIAMTAARKAELEKARGTPADALKVLLHIRNSIDHHVNPKPGLPPTFSVQAGGLSELRKEVNAMIEGLPGGDILRDADKVKSGALAMKEKLGGLQKKPGEVIEFLKNTFEGKGPNASEDTMNLLAFDKMVTEAGGKSVIEPLHKAMTVAHFAPALAGNQISRQIAGASPFLISALLRTVGVPFQAALPASAALVSAARSPRMQGGMIRAAQKYGPGIEKNAGKSASTALNIIRNLGRRDEDE